MNEAARFEQVFETGQAQPWPRAPGALEALTDLGLARETALCRSYACGDCGMSHLVLRENDGSFSLDCPEGVRTLETDRLRQWRANNDQVAQWLSEALGVAQPQERLSGRFWYLGSVDLGTGTFPVWLTRRCASPDLARTVRESLQTRSPAEQGVVISSAPVEGLFDWPRGSSTVRLSDLLVWNEGTWSVDRRTLKAAAPKRLRLPGQRGAPKRNDFDVLGAFQDGVANGEACKNSLRDEAKRIRKLQEETLPDELCHQVGTLENRLSDAYRQWKSSGFDPKSVST